MPNQQIQLEEEEHWLQEAHMHHCILDFGEMVRQWGIERIMKDIDQETYWILEKWFIRGEK